MNDFLYQSNSKIYDKEPQHNKTLLKKINFGSPLALCYIKIPLHVRNVVTGTDCVRRQAELLSYPACVALR